MKTVKPRSLKQNSSLWKWDKMMVEYLNKHDQSIQFVLSHAVERMWQDEDVVRLLFKPILKHITGDGSTKKATTTEIIKAYEVLADHLSMKIASVTGHPIPAWPVKKEKDKKGGMNEKL
jgi:hypothetical protein